MAFHAGKGHKYYVWYLGWKECRNLRDRDYILPIATALVSRRSSNDLPKLTLEFAKKELKISQEKEKRKGKTEKIKYPSIQLSDITFACKVYDDVVCCVYLGLNPKTNCVVHVHVYRFDSGSTANSFLKDTSSILEAAVHQERLRKIEEDLIASGQIEVKRLQRDQASVLDGQKMRLENDPYSKSEQPRRSLPSLGVEDRRSDRQSGGEQDLDEKGMLFTSVNDELRAKLNLDTAPILLPPKDYDTVRRKHGDLEGIEERKSQQIPIVGDRGASLTEDLPIRSNQSRKHPKLAILKRDSLESGQDSGIGGTNEFPSPSSDHSNQLGFPDRDLGREIRYEDRDSETVDLKMVTPVWKRPDMYRFPTAQKSPPPARIPDQIETKVSYSRRSSEGSAHSGQGSNYGSGKSASRNPSFKSDSGELAHQGYISPRNIPGRDGIYNDVGPSGSSGNLQVNNSPRRLSNTSGQGEHDITHISNRHGNERPLLDQHDYRYVKTKSPTEIPDQRYLQVKDQRSSVGEKPDPRYLESNRRNSGETGLYSYFK